ncbi:LON peptidase substrate-binding domain-containing protein [Vibrio sp. 10N]|uniref:LON peptidase substrate-binding domain-containing protein n=1 Tax=Vibrio sp. 10N TaxID=3058938 RepID=UPI0028146B17|nr:LON peptidase substrate-binding domain-containing protein [Vibrio sp. 10N]
MSQIMLFPLRSVVLPEGKMRLRIFEPRYKRMVTECLKRETGFGVCLISSKNNAAPKNVSEVGTFVSIVDFETLEDGMLGITVSGIKKFRITDVGADDDGLRHASVVWLDDWATAELGDENQFLGERLQDVYNKFPQIGDLYLHRFFDDAAWVSQRWLEVLPLDCHHFEHLVTQPDCSSAVNFLADAFKSGDIQEETRH